MNTSLNPIRPNAFRFTPRLKRHLIGTLALACLALPVAKSAAVNTVVSDDFTGVTRYTLNDYHWYFYGGANTTAWRITTDNTAPLSGEALWNYGSSGNWIYGVRQFNNVKLSNVGDYITLSLDYHTTVDTTSCYLNMALLNSANTVAVNALDGTNPISDADGYMAYQLVKTTATTADLKEAVDAPAYNLGTKLVTTSGSAILGAAANAHAVSFTLTRVETGIQLSYSVDGTVMGTTTDTTSYYDTFNTIRLFDGGVASGAVNLDNIVLTTNVPEPTTMAMVAFAGGLGLLFRYQASNRKR